MYDFLIINGKVITGSGNPWFMADLGVKDGFIVRIGHLVGSEAGRIIDAAGCMVCPGFIDGHSHSDLMIFEDPLAQAKVMQGVTTENLGLDGMSVAPIREDDVPGWRKHLSGLAGDPPINWTWRSFGDYLDALDSLPPSDNLTAYVGLGTIRLQVMGMTDGPASSGQIEAMKALAAQSMEQGARGISSGLIYPPSQYQSIDEVVQIAEVVRAFGGIYDVHMRTEGDGILEAMEEVIDIGRRSGIPVLITHFKVMGQRNWGLSDQTLGLVDSARAEGVEIHLALYPYVAASTMLHAIVPPWFHAKGPDELVRMLQEDREPVKRDIRERSDWENWARANGWENIVVSSVASQANKQYEGLSVTRIAEMRNQSDPADAALDLLAEENLSVGMIIFCMSEEDVTAIMTHPSVNIITDGLLGGKPHPRVYGSFPRVLGRYVREKKVLGLEEAVRKMTSLPAEKLHLNRKGLLAEGYDADITIFDPEAVIDTATFEKPRQHPTGIEWVLVNGVSVVEHGRHSGARPGRTVRSR